MQQGQLNRTYVSSISFMDQREILNKVLDLYDEEETIVDIMQAMNRYVPTAQTTFNYHVNTRVHSAAELGVLEAAPAAGAASTITLTGGSVKPRVGDMMLTAGRYRSLVTAVSGNDVTVKPVNNTVIAHEALAAGDKVTFFSNAYAEGTSVSEGYIYPTLQYANNVQIFKGDFSVTDLQAMTQVEVEFGGKPYYFIKGQNDALKRFKMDVAYGLLLGEKSASLTDANGKTVLTTQGLEKTIRGNGIDLPLDTATTAAFQADFKDFNRALDQARAPMEYMLWCGPSIGNYFDDWLTEKEGVKAGGVVYNSFNGIGGKERAIQLGFDSFRMYDRTFHKKKLYALDNPELTAATDFTYPDTVMFIPANKIKTEYDTESKDRLRVRYLESTSPVNSGVNSAYANGFYEILTGGLAPIPTSKEMRLDISYTSWQGLEVLGAEHFAINNV